MLRWMLLAVVLAATVGCAATHGEIRAAADHDAYGPRAGVSVSASW